MAQLTLDSDLGLGADSPLILHSISTYIPSSCTLIVKGTRLLHNGERYTIFRGTLYPPDGSEPFDVVLKTYLGASCSDGLSHEANLYETTLKSLQEDSIPLYYGIFQTVIKSRTLTCLVLEYCGTLVGRFFREMCMDFRLRVIKKLETLHKAGVLHGDFSPSNVVIDDEGDPWIIDLEYATAHVCKQAMPIKEGGIMPFRHQFGCNELYALAVSMRVWYPCVVHFFGRAVVISRIKSPDQLLSLFPDVLSTRVSREQALSRARRIMKFLGDNEHPAFRPDPPSTWPV